MRVVIQYLRYSLLRIPAKLYGFYRHFNELQKNEREKKRMGYPTDMKCRWELKLHRLLLRQKMPLIAEEEKRAVMDNEI